MASSLNPLAPVFVPQYQRWNYDAYNYSYGDENEEANVSSEELEELEACEEWVRLQAELEEMERDHLVALALSEAPPEQILAVEMRAMAMEGGDKASHHSGKQHQQRKARH